MRVVPQSGKRLFHLLRIDSLLLDTSTNRNEKERGPHGDSLVGQQRGHRIELPEITPCDRGVDLYRHAQFAGVLEHDHGSLKTPFPAAEGIMGLGIHAVQADSQPLNAGILRLLEGLPRG